MSLTQLSISISRGNVPIPINESTGGSLFANAGPDTVYYGPSRNHKAGVTTI